MLVFRFLIATVMMCLIACPAAQAQIGIPDTGQSYANAASGLFEIAPDGSGPTLTERGLSITVVVLDYNDDPIPGFPFQDIWVHDNAGATELSLCQYGSFASGNTNIDGMTTIEGPFFGGGTTNAGLQVYLSGVPLDPGVSPPLDIAVSSADLDGNLSVDIADLTNVPGGFANLFLNGSYDWQVDFDADNAENILDVVRFAELFLGQATCP